MRFEVLGGVRAINGVSPGEEVVLGGHKQQLVLALLLAEPNLTVSTDALVDRLWGDSPPSTARHTLQSYVSELRKVTGPAVEREGAGYVARVDRRSLDSLEFEALVAEGQDQIATDPESASATLAEALDLWRDEPFSGFDDHHTLRAESRRLQELRLVALEDRVGADLVLGRHVELAGELDGLTTEHPYREELRAQHMLALYRSGRQAEALRAYQRTRSVLAEELGIEPTPRLRRLEEQILVQDPDLDLQSADAGPDASVGPVHNPYKGLRPFGEKDADDFFGRDRLVGQLHAAVTSDARLVAVVGPSGSGKSSAVQAGLVPALRDDLGGGWVIASMLPGAHPFVELEAALLRSVEDSPDALLNQLTESDSGLLRAALRLLPDDGTRLLLVIDQFEELFTLVDEEACGRFLASLVTAAEDARGRVRVVFTLRADFYERPLMYPAFGQLMTGSVVNVTPLAPDELEAAAVGPAARMGVEFEPGLLVELMSDVAGQPNALPLFQYALTELFDRREDSVLTLAAYQEIGGLRRAVAIRAEEMYQRLDPDQEDAATQLFLRLVTVGEDSETRRRVGAGELLSLDVDPVAMQSAVEAFARHRLLALDRDPYSGAPTVEVSHEALLTEWERLSGWISDNREHLRRHTAYALAVDDWLTAGRDPDYLLAGGRLDQYEQWRASTPMRLTAPEREFLDQAVTRRDEADATETARLAEETRLRRRARGMIVALAGLAVAALVATISAVVISTGGNSTPTVATIGFGTDDDQVGELYNQGLVRAEQEFGVTIERVDLLLPPEEMLAALSGDLVLISNELSFTAFDQPELLDPDSHYVLEIRTPPGYEPPANVTVVFWANEQAGYLAGVAAASTSQSGTIGFLGATPFNADFRAGFEAGARSVEPSIEILAANVSDFGLAPNPWESPELGRAVAPLLYEDGADVIFHAAGRTGFGVFEAAEALSTEEHKLWAIGVDTDQWQTASLNERDHVLTSVVKRVDLQAFTVIGDFLDGTLVSGVSALTVVDDRIDFTTTGDHLSAEALENLEAAKADLAAGSIDVPIVPSGPLIAPSAALEIKVVFDGESCVFEGTPRVTAGEPVGFELVNETAGPAWLYVVEDFTYTSLKASAGSTASHASFFTGDEVWAVCSPIGFGPFSDAGVFAGPIEVE